MPWRWVGWVSFASLFTGLASAQAPEIADTGGFQQINSWLIWALVWILLAGSLCTVLFKLYSQWPSVERRLVVATLAAMPPAATILTTAHVPLLGELATREGNFDYVWIFAFWVVVALCFDAAWRVVKSRSPWLEPSHEKSQAKRAEVPEQPTPQEKSADSASRTDSRGGTIDPNGLLDEAPAPPAVRRAQTDSEQARVSERKPQPASAANDSIFISYRRQDSADVTGRIYDRLIQRFNRQQVFKDVDSIPLGVDFRAHLGDVVGRCNLLLAVIGPQWLTAAGSNGRRLDDVGDFVRIEIEAALARNIPVIPLLVGGADLPPERELPPSLAPITFRNGIAIRPDPDFHRDMDRLIAGLESHHRG